LWWLICIVGYAISKTLQSEPIKFNVNVESRNEEARDLVSWTMRQIRMRVLRIVVTMLCMYACLLPRKTKREYRRRSKTDKLIKLASKGVTKAMKRLLDWLERTLGPPRRRRCVSSCRITRQRPLSGHDKKSRAIGLALSVLAMNAKTAIATERVAHFDTDSEWIGVDNRCSGCISHVRSDFVSELKASNRVVKGFGGSRTTNVKIGTLRWSWEDDQGRTHTFDIKNSYYIPDGKVRLLSPQHWAQSQATTSNKSLKTSCGEHTNGLECVLYWGDGEYKRHIDLGRNDNVATFPLAHGYSHFAAFCSEAGMDDQDREMIAMPSAFISDDESVAHEEVEERPAQPWSQH
jgi:hypothetical protein